jgi:osmotically-inducible protein OsmY
LPNAPPSQHADTSAERDQRIALEVRAGLSHDAHVARDTRNVQVTAVDGVVILTGTVSSDADRHAIRSQAERVSGVVRVEDQLVVR